MAKADPKFKIWIHVERADNPGGADEIHQDLGPICAGERPSTALAWTDVLEILIRKFGPSPSPVELDRIEQAKTEILHASSPDLD